MSFSELHRLNSMSLGEAALAYGRLGVKITPLWGVTLSENGSWQCDCREQKCRDDVSRRGKHPWGPGAAHGVNDASSDEDQINEWWSAYPNANIGAACGLSGWLVIDVDQRETGAEARLVDGHDSLATWAADHDVIFPTTLKQRSGSGGSHLVFRDPGGIKNISWLECVEFKTVGGYIVVSPSRHGSGELYRWTESHEPAVLPELAVQELRSARSRSKNHAAGGAPGEGPPGYNYKLNLEHGPRYLQRDFFFNDYAFRCRTAGMSEQQCEIEIKDLWERAEQPEGRFFPWEDALAKVRRVWRTVGTGLTPEQIAIASRWARAEQDIAESRPRLFAVPSMETERNDATGGEPETAWQGHHFDPDEQLTDRGGAARFMLLNASHHMSVTEGPWYEFDEIKGCWSLDPRAGAARKVGMLRVIASYQADRVAVAADDETRFDSWITDLGNRRRVSNILADVEDDPAWRIDHDLLDVDENLVHTPGATLVNQGDHVEVRAPDWRDRITRSLATHYDPNARAPLFESVVRTMCFNEQGEPRPEYEHLIQQLAGACLFAGGPRLQVLPFLYGAENSGKSTVIEAINAVFGDYGAFLDKEALTGDEEMHTHLLLPLVGARHASVDKEFEKERVNVSRINSLVTGKKFKARDLYEKNREHVNSAMIWLEGNEKFKAGRVRGFWRRILTIHLPWTVPLAERDDKLAARLLEESSGILNWLIDGHISVTRDGLLIPSGVLEDTAEYRKEEDIIMQFVQDMFEKHVSGEEVRHRSNEFYPLFCCWAMENGIKGAAVLQGPIMLRQLLEDEKRYGFKRGDKDERLPGRGGRKRSRVCTGPPMTPESEALMAWATP